MGREVSFVKTYLSASGSESLPIRFQPVRRVLESPETSLRFIKKCFRASEK